MQRGAISLAFRVIPKEIPDFEQLRMPKGVLRLADEHRGLVATGSVCGSVYAPAEAVRRLKVTRFADR